MVYWLVLLLAFAAGVAGFYKVSAMLGKEHLMPAQPKKINRIADNAQAIAANATEKIRFDARIRGYDPTQVDAVIDALRAEIDRLRAELG